MANMLNCNIVVCEFEHFQTNIIEKGMNSLVPPV